ncbi:MAG: DinB family protein [Cytophagaceae bacterium]
MKEFFIDLFNYNHSCNQKLADAFVTNSGNTSDKSVKLFSHILNAHHIWNHRINSQQPKFPVWELQSVDQFKNTDRVNYEQTIQILDNADYSSILNYTTSRGDSFSNSIREILFHIINHSTYHRGQIASDFRQSGLEPLASDYIFYKR